MTVVPSCELNISPFKGTFEDVVPFPKVGYVIVSWRVVTNMDTQNDALKKVNSFVKTATFSIYLSFRGCISLYMFTRWWFQTCQTVLIFTPNLGEDFSDGLV